MDEWIELEQFPGYSVNRCGYVKGKQVSLLKPKINHDGYAKVGLCIDGIQKNMFIHRLIALAFLPNPNNLPEVNHINNIRDDNRLENLEWISAIDNNHKRLGFNYVSWNNKRQRWVVKITRYGITTFKRFKEHSEAQQFVIKYFTE